MKLDKNTQIILAIGAIAITAYAVHSLAEGANQAEESIGSGIGTGATVLGIGGFAWLIAAAAAL